MKYFTLVLCVALVLIGAGSCKKNPVEPPDEERENLTPGRRDYTWTVDTIKNKYVDLYGIWGETPDEVFVVGTGGGKLIWRYDGKSWLPENRVYVRDPMAIYGYKDKMWICGMEGEIWRYENGVFIKELDLLINEGKRVGFYGIEGKSSDEIYAVGCLGVSLARDGYIYKYTNSSWTLHKILENKGIINLINYSKRNNVYYFSTYLTNNTNTDTVRLYSYDGNELRLLSENRESAITMLAINTIDEYVYETVNKKAYRFIKENAEYIFEVNNPNFGGQLWGRGRNDILIRMFDGIAHYNGTDWQYLLKLSNIVLDAKAAIFEKEVFIPAKDNNTGYSLIYHGVLK